ncbi:VWFA and cache domain-containing protein 1-like [Oppia nitens]|uniref:VWFA and cache domain-containing protein 1-like n=1 Tax=Oppia nitens TaxID=1686743 RepID=UPI0023DAFD63|nr:VWFA and cache domain-containing protein 1-like [Oppia nitens]
MFIVCWFTIVVSLVGVHHSETIGGDVERRLSSVSDQMKHWLQLAVNHELGVAHLQHIYRTVNSVTHDIQFNDIVSDITQKMTKKLEDLSAVLEETSERVKELFQIYLKGDEIKTLRPCCDQRLHAVMHFDGHFNTQITKATACDSVPNGVTDGSFSPGINLTEQYRANLDIWPNIKWQYFISIWGLHTEFPAYLPLPNSCHTNDVFNDINDFNSFANKLVYNDVYNEDTLQRHRDIYMATVLPQSKNILLVIDRGSALTAHQLAIAKAIAKYILNSLSLNDKIGLISVSSDIHYPISDSCLTKRLANANYETKYQFQRFIDGLQRTNENTNHVLGLKNAFEMLANTFEDIKDNESPSEALIVYISRGLLTALTDARLVMEVIANEINKAYDNNYSFVINSYALIDDTKPVMYEMDFLREIAEMNFQKFNVLSPDPFKIRPGMMVAVNSTDNLSFTLSGIYSVLTRPTHSSVYISLPYWDAISKDVHISVSKSVIHRGQLIGVVGLDISLADLAEDIIQYVSSDDSYAFLIEKTHGIAIHHPLFSPPNRQTHDQIIHTSIEHFEQIPGFDVIKKSMLANNEGIETIKVNFNNKTHITYQWRRVLSSPYIVVIASFKTHDRKHSITAPLAKDIHFTYHRLDLNANPSILCRHFKQLATIETATLFIPSKAFLSPFANDMQEETTHVVQRYMAYLNDNTKLIANPGFKSTIRGEVHVITGVIPLWKTLLESSEMSKFIVRKYITTPNGVFLLYPGALIDKSFDPTRREWYTKAVLNPGKVVFTAPYLDVGGAGYIVTISHVIEGYKSDTNTNTRNTVAVIAMDFTLGYFHSFLQTNLGSFCRSQQVRCFIMDDKGYLIAHPSLVEPIQLAPIEQQHITHKEPLVANDLLHNKLFVKKTVCNSFADRTIQRFYNFNTSLTGVLTNSIHDCGKYLIASVSDSNIFIGIVNHTCDSMAAFCPCSMTDRLCLNCHRMEQTDCECPCECPLELNLCTGQLFDEEDRNPSCPPITDSVRPVPVMKHTLESIKKCFDISCYEKKSENECQGLMGCEWCQLDRNGETPLKNPYCNNQNRCFGGILGAKTPYPDEISDMMLAHDDYMPMGSAPVGPVAGGIMICFVVLALSVYCYRYHSTRHGPHYITSITDNGVNPLHLDNDFDDNDPQDDIAPAIVPNNVVVLASFENAAQVSPYRINAGYRRPGGDSDHGYSTMTPHEDSELAGPTYNEPLLVGRDRTRLLNTSSQSDATNSSSRTSSPSLVCQSIVKPPKPMPSTILEVPNNVLAQVQVHTVDTH